MKYLILLTALSFCLFSCSSSPEDKAAATEKESSPEQNIAVVRNYIQAVEELDHEAMSQYLADTYVGVGPSYGDSINKEQAVANWKLNTAQLYERIRYTRSQFAPVTIAQGASRGEWVANWAELHIVFQGELDSVTIWANTNYQVEKGKIVKSITFYNEADVLRQLGYTFTPPQEDAIGE